MQKKESYAELLRSPMWQKKRLEIMERDNFTCQHCGCTHKVLQVHHREYIKGRKPWKYEDDNLVTLCEDCHEKEHEFTRRTRAIVGEVYLFHHGDSTNYMLCYSINHNKGEICLLSVDDLASTSTTWFETVTTTRFEKNYIHFKNFWNNSFSEDNYWQEILCRCLVDLYTRYKWNKYSTQIFNNFIYPDKVVIDYARKRIDEIINNNDVLYQFFYKLLNED